MAHKSQAGLSQLVAMDNLIRILTAIALVICVPLVSGSPKGMLGDSPENRRGFGIPTTYERERRSPRGLFSPRLEYDEWTPLGRGDPLKNDPTYDYVPPVLERVHYWIDPSSRTPDVPQPTPAVALPAPSPSSTTPPTADQRMPQQNIPQVPSSPTTVIVYPANVRSPIPTPAAPEGHSDPFDSVADARLDAHPFLTFVDGPKFTPKQPPITPSTLPPHKRVTHYGEFRPLSTPQPQKHHSHGPSPPQPMRAHSTHPYRMSPPYYNPTRISHVHSHGSHLQIGQLEEGEISMSTSSGQPPTPLQMLVPPPLPGTESQVPFTQHNVVPQEQTLGQTLTSPEMQRPSPATAPDPNTTPVYPVFTAPTTIPPKEVIPTHPPTTPPTPTTTEETENATTSTPEVKEPVEYMVPPPNDPLSPIPDFSDSTIDIQESLELTTSNSPFSFPTSITDKWITHSTNFEQISQFAQTSQSTQPPTTTVTQTTQATTYPILYVTFPPTTTTSQAPPTTTPSTPPTTTTPSLTTDPLFSHYKQPSAPLRGPMYLIIEGHSKVKTYGAGKNSIHGIPIVGSGEKESTGDRSKGPRRRVGSGRSLWEDPVSIGMLPPPETDPSENDVLREEWVAAAREKHGVFVVPAWGTPRRQEGGDYSFGQRALQK